MDIASTLSAADRASLDMQVDAFNASLNGTRSPQQNLGKDDFLKILITQLQHQDATKPMEDREFIAQMAQFSSLEQMTNMSSQFTELAAMLKGTRAMNLIGRNVEIVQGDSFIQGSVEAVTGGAFPQLLVNGAYYDLEDISKVTE
ncbi:MAG: flagellar hook assembly protein FlgD [Spirochaetaceae bacterium]|nr:flagellar hook assembly protein FlgD [Spirochaetaceae bacterium]